MVDGEGPGAPRGPREPNDPLAWRRPVGRRAAVPPGLTGDGARGGPSAPTDAERSAAKLTESEVLRLRLAQTEEALRQSEQRFADMVAIAPTAVVVAQDGELAAANAACIRLLGLESPAHVIGRSLSDFVHADDWEAVASFLAGHLSLGVAGPGKEGTGSVTTRLVGPGDYQVTVELVGMAVQHAGRPAVQFFASDVTDLEETERLLSHQALHDPLTGLPNRLLFVDRVGQALARSPRAHSRVGVFFCDLDRFQVVNDGLGHAVGDRVLLMAAERLQGSLRPSDTVARFSGDEFVVLCELSREPGDVPTVAKRLLASMSDPFDVDDTTFTMSASIGVAVAEDRFVEPEDLIRDAAAATSQAKVRGRNRFEVFSPATRERALGRIHIESSLRRAMEDGHLRVYYQPMVECHTGRLVGAEALVRWQHPEHGLVMPGSFIPIAEESGLIVAVGAWVLERACWQANEWEGKLPPGQTLHLSVNLSAHQLHDPELVGRVRALIERFPARQRQVILSLEVTETTLVRDAEATTEALENLDALGVQIGIDDFGTGYSSLSYLKRFPVTTIKVDRTFIQSVDENPDDRAIVQAVIQLAHNLGLTVIAEGVEREAQRRLLADLGCDLVQGYLFGRPLAEEVMTELILNRDGPVYLGPGHERRTPADLGAPR
ncbi:MAG: bifunctional diguanylate cyclase/phosphodiesterase [Actinomycetota bacterium]|nr:bifunctional diguanylate cyclase/phosphodiesterase [Actinomycetota bacterium]